MDRIQNQKHNKETFYYSLSRMLESILLWSSRSSHSVYDWRDPKNG